MTDVIRRSLSRAAVYRVLATAFAYPERGHAGELARVAAAAMPAATPAVRSRLAELARRPDPMEVDDLAEQYVRLFDRQVACPPYEGAYGAPQLAGKAMQLADIAGFYAAFGMTATDRQPDADDHVGAELEFMGTLALKEAWARGQGWTDHAEIARSAQRTFFEDHLGRWGSAFAARVLETAPPGIYMTAARLLDAWLGEESAYLDVAPAAAAARAADDDAPLACPMV
jgi:DMSO reductase family type II enzyme chaperone